MKNLKSIGLVAATVASFAVNSNAQTKVVTIPAAKMETIVDKPQTVILDNPVGVNTEKRQMVILDNPAEVNTDKLQKTVLDNPINANISGTFYGEKLYWSSENNELYFEGKSIIKFGKNNTITNGRINFLGKVFYLVIDGKPAKLGDKISLTNKKYSLRSLSAQTALAKYGDSGKNGAIEIDIEE